MRETRTERREGTAGYEWRVWSGSGSAARVVLEWSANAELVAAVTKSEMGWNLKEREERAMQAAGFGPAERRAA